MTLLRHAAAVAALAASEVASDTSLGTRQRIFLPLAKIEQSDKMIHRGLALVSC